MNRIRKMGWSWRSEGGFSYKSLSARNMRELAAQVTGCLGVCGLLLMVSCSTPPAARQPEEPRFNRAASADLIVKYFSDQVSHLLKPLTMEGPFYVACERSAVLNLAGQQPKRELAVVLLVHYISSTEENRVKVAWTADLKRLGYSEVVFLLASRGTQVDGLPVLKGPDVQATLAQH